MDICTHCKAYSIHFIDGEQKKCELCKKVTAIFINGQWERIVLPD